MNSTIIALVTGLIDAIIELCTKGGASPAEISELTREILHDQLDLQAQVASAEAAEEAVLRGGK